MTDFASLLVADRGQPAHLIHIVDKNGFEDWFKDQPQRARTALTTQKFKGKPLEMAIVPGEAPDEWSVVIGVANAEEFSPWCLAKPGGSLPEGQYRLANAVPGPAALGWLLAQHSFNRYRSETEPHSPAVLLSTEVAAIDENVRIAKAVALVRDLVDTPAADMGPGEIAEAVEALAQDSGASITITQGDQLTEDYPMIAAVGRAATRERAPRLIELEWGDPARPRVAIIGKGVSFDTGGLDLKPSSGMLLMKKDMGGAAHAIALAQLIIGARLPIRLHLLIPAVENAIAGNAFRPGDVLHSRKGITVEIGNTDAEGRLILGDALARACESDPVYIFDFATLTGAARVALGPDLPGLFVNDDSLAGDIAAAARQAEDPLWRLPLWQPYGDMLKSTIADINNAGEGGMAGATTAALFLEKFVSKDVKWAHLDTFAWRPSPKPGRPKGGDALGLRAIYTFLKTRFSA